MAGSSGARGIVFAVLVVANLVLAVPSRAQTVGGNGGYDGSGFGIGGPGGGGYLGMRGSDGASPGFGTEFGGGGGGGGSAGGGLGGNGGNGAECCSQFAAGGSGGASAGANGLPGGSHPFLGGAGGGGGAGGANGFSGAALTGAHSTGGDGGAGGAGGNGTLFRAGGGGGGGGAGGYGAIVPGGGVHANGATIAAGRGGAGGNGGISTNGQGGRGGDGGEGGIGLYFLAPGGATLTNTGSIVGGAGGAGGSGGGGSTAGSAAAGGAGIVGGNLTVINGGTITGGLAGDNMTRANAITFTGGTNILELHAGSSITGNVAGTGASVFRLGGSTDSSFDVSTLGAGQQYRGFSSLAKTGTSTWTLTGTATATTSWTIDAGTLAVNGSTAASTLTTVNSGGTLGGTGTVGATTIASGGTLAPGNSIGTITVNGPLTFNAGSNYNIEVSPSAADRTNVIGAASLNGTVNASYAPGSYVARQYTILNATTGVSGTFSALHNTSLPSTVSAALSYDANNVYLNLTLNYMTPGGRLDINQQNVSNALENHFNTTGGIPAAFASLSANGLSQASGEAGGGAQQSALTSAGLFMGNVFDNAFGNPNAGGQGAAPLGYAPQRGASSAAQQAYAAVTPRDRQTSSIAPFERRWSLWASGYGGNARVSGDSAAGSHDTTSRVYGVAIGATRRVSADTQLGFALGGAGSSFSLAEGFGSGKADSFNAALYARHAFGPAYVAAALGYSWQDASTDRTVSAGGVTEVLHASFRPQALTTRFEGGRRFTSAAFGVTPFAAIQTTTLFLPSYGEAATSGTGTFALSYGSRSFTATRGELGARFDKTVMLGDKPLALKAKAAWAHDWNNDRIATATFQQLPGATFTVSGAKPAADAALLSFGADLAIGRGWSVGAGFDGEFSRTAASYSGKGSVRYAW